MTDYRLECLSTRSFEHLVQSLAYGHVTKAVLPFGDGPDGGREATFDGVTTYPSETSPWIGYGIIQAKFRQKLTNSSEDGKWVLQELKKELREFTRVKNKRVIPQYYIFVTNVALTPVAESGTKDKVIDLLEKFKRENNLIDYDIWDYDKLRVILDNNQNVQDTYGAWITAGDVLAQLSGFLRSRQINYYSVLSNFLQKEMIQDRFAKLEQAGHSADEAIPLSQVFVDLPVALEPAPDTDNLAREGTKFASLIIRAAGDQLTQSSDSTQGLKPPLRSGRYVLIGGPGQGKTTLGQFICQVFRTSLLVDVEQALIETDVKLAMDEVVSQWSTGVLPRPDARRLPFRIVLSEFAKKLSDGEVTGILDYLAKYVSRRTGASLDIADIRVLLLKYPSIMVLDGLDEVPPSTNRNAVMQAVRDFSIDVASEAMDVLLLATSRPQGYNEDFSSAHYLHLYLLPLPAAVALDYAKRLTKIRFNQEIDRQDKIISRLLRAADSPATARLMTSPLQVTIMTLLVDRMGQPPQERWALFNEYYKLIYQREIERDIPAATTLRDYRADINAIHKQVALVLQIESERSGGTDARLATEQFADLVRCHLQEEGHTGEGLELVHKSIIDAATNRLVFLVGLEAGLVGFEIRSLQEFMAAEGLMEHEDSVVQNRLRSIAPVANWRNVFLFAAGRCFADRRYLRDTIGQICYELNESTDDQLAKLTYAGSQLALDLLEDGSAAKQPIWCRTLTRQAARLLDIDDFELSQRLIAIYQDANAEVFLEEVRARLSSPSERIRESVFGVAARLADLTGTDLAGLVSQLDMSVRTSYTTVNNLAKLGDGRNGLVRNAIVAALPRMRLQDVQRVFSYYPSSPAIWHPEKSRPAWLKAIMKMTSPNSDARLHRLTVTDGRKNAVCDLYISPIDQPRDFTALSGATFEGDDWAYLKQLIDFLGSPSKDVLVETLEARRIASPLPGLFIGHGLVPWPLARAIDDAYYGVGWDTVISDAKGGRYGDIGEWRAFESLTASPIDISTIVDSNARISCRSVELGESNEALELFLRFVETCYDGYVPEVLGWTFVHSVVQRAFHNDKRFLKRWSDRAISLGFNIGEPYSMDTVLNYLVPDDPTDPKWHSLVKQIGPTVAGRLGDGGVATILAMAGSAWRANPSVDLLGPFAAVAQASRSSLDGIPDVSSLKLSDLEAEQLLNAVVIRLCRNEPLAEMEDAIVRLLNYNPYYLRILSSTLSSQDSELYEKRLLELNRIVTAAGNGRFLFGELRSLASRRISRFLDEKTWTDLRFSPSLRSLVLERLS